jgi:hypothetical protein
MAAAGNKKEGKSKRRPGKEPSVQEAIENAADKYGNGSHEVKVDEIWATVDVSSPGQVREYRVIVDK